MVCFTLPGIQKLYIAKEEDVDYSISTGNTVVLNVATQFDELEFQNANFTQKRINDQRGKYYTKELSVIIPSMLDESAYGLENESLLLIFKANDGNYWATGMEKPFTVSKLESGTGGNENRVELTITQNSYLSIQPIIFSQPNIIIT